MNNGTNMTIQNIPATLFNTPATMSSASSTNSASITPTANLLNNGGGSSNSSIKVNNNNNNSTKLNNFSQQQQQRNNNTNNNNNNQSIKQNLDKSNEESLIRDVWASNLHEEMAYLCLLVEKYPYLSMDTEFPGVVARPIGSFKTSADYHYQTLRCNVDLLNMIQLGITFADENGNLPTNNDLFNNDNSRNGICTWQFNFKFSLSTDMYANDSIELLQKSGIDFRQHQENGIDVADFGELLMTSGLVLFDEVNWISFHSMYDFGYLLKLVMGSSLPETEVGFFDSLMTYFPNLFDIKFLMKTSQNMKGGLQDLATDLGVERIGPQHQAGSDSLLTCMVFFKMKQVIFDNQHDPIAKFKGQLYGLNNGNLLQTFNNLGNNNNSSAIGSDSSTPINANSRRPSQNLLLQQQQQQIPNMNFPPITSKDELSATAGVVPAESEEALILTAAR